MAGQKLQWRLGFGVAGDPSNSLPTIRCLSGRNPESDLLRKNWELQRSYRECEKL